MGHKNGLDGIYLTPTRQQCFEEFVKGISQLTISDSQRHKMIIRNLENDKSELEKKNVELVEYKKKIDQLWADKQRMENPKKT